MKVTLNDYLMWIAGGRTRRITPDFVENELMLENMDADQIWNFYTKYKDTELKDFKEEYPSGTYKGANDYDTKISFYIDDMHFVIPDVYGSFLHRSKRKQKDFSGKISAIRSKCLDEMIEIVKENLGENGEERIVRGYDCEGNGIMMKDSDDPIIYHITSIGCKVEDGEVTITLYCNEDHRSAINWDIEDCEDINAFTEVYNTLYWHFNEDV